jgi:hypothetical protein
MLLVKRRTTKGHADGKTQKKRKAVPVDLGNQVSEKPVFPLLETIPEKTGAFYKVTWRNYYWFAQGESPQQIIDELHREGVIGIQIRKATDYENPSV